MVTWSPDDHSTNLNGPVPFIVVAASGPSEVSLSRMRKYRRESNAPGRGTSEERTTVYLSGVSMPLQSDAPGPTVARFRVFGSCALSSVYLMSSLVNSRPLWYWTPLRRLNLSCLLSELSSQLSASRGTGLNFSSKVINWSWTWPTVLLLLGDHWNGSRVVMSPTMPTRSVPPVFN